MHSLKGMEEIQETLGAVDPNPVTSFSMTDMVVDLLWSGEAQTSTS